MFCSIFAEFAWFLTKRPDITSVLAIKSQQTAENVNDTSIKNQNRVVKHLQKICELNVMVLKLLVESFYLTVHLKGSVKADENNKKHLIVSSFQ